jgi:hypothetical protein
MEVICQQHVVLQALSIVRMGYSAKRSAKNLNLLIGAKRP